MSIYDELRKHYGVASAEQKLKVLREELLRPILTVQTSAHLLKQVAPEIAPCLPSTVDADELRNTLNWLGEAAEDLQQILDALTLEATEPPAPHSGD
jgi:hypothetical protein